MDLALEINSVIGSSRYVCEMNGRYVSTLHRCSNALHIPDQAAVVSSQALIPPNNVFITMLQYISNKVSIGLVIIRCSHMLQTSLFQDYSC